MRVTQRIANRGSLVLFMRRSVVARHCGFFKDKIVTTVTRRERDKGGLWKLRFISVIHKRAYNIAMKRIL